LSGAKQTTSRPWRRCVQWDGDRCEEWPSRMRKRFCPAAFSRVCGSKTRMSQSSAMSLFVHPFSEHENLLVMVILAGIFFPLKTVVGLIELPSAPIVTKTILRQLVVWGFHQGWPESRPLTTRTWGELWDQQSTPSRGQSIRRCFPDSLPWP